MLPRPGERPFHQVRRQCHAGRNAVVPGTKVIQRGRIARIVGARGHLVEEAARHQRTGQHHMRSQQVIILAMRKRPHHGPFVRKARQPRQVLANLNPCSLRGDGLEFTANLGGRVGLEIEQIDVTRRAR